MKKVKIKQNSFDIMLMLMVDLISMQKITQRLAPTTCCACRSIASLAEISMASAPFVSSRV